METSKYKIKGECMGECRAGPVIGNADCGWIDG